MAKTVLTLVGLQCPMPQLKMSQEAGKMAKGDILEALANCPTFEADVRNWCTRTKHTLLWIKPEGTAKRVQVSIAYGATA